MKDMSYYDKKCGMWNGFWWFCDWMECMMLDMVWLEQVWLKMLECDSSDEFCFELKGKWWNKYGNAGSFKFKIWKWSMCNKYVLAEHGSYIYMLLVCFETMKMMM